MDQRLADDGGVDQEVAMGNPVPNAPHEWPDLAEHLFPHVGVERGERLDPS